MAEQDFTEIARLAEKFNKDPKSRIFVQLADAYRKNNMVDEALEILNQGLQYHPNYPLAYLILGKCYVDKRMYAQAKDAFEKTIEFDPVNIVALRLLAQVCETLKDEACQIKAYKGIIAIDPTDEMAQNKLNQLEARQRKGEIYTLTLAQEYEKQGNLEKALEVYEHLSFMDPTDLTIKHKINELRSRISGVVQEIKKEVAPEPIEVKTEETKVHPLIEEPHIPEPQLGEHVIDLDVKVQEPVLEEIQPKIGEEKLESTTESPPVQEVTPEEEIHSLEEFLVKTEEITEEKPSEPAGEPSESAVISGEVELEKPIEEPVAEGKLEMEEIKPAEQIKETFEQAPEIKEGEPASEDKIGITHVSKEESLKQGEKKEEASKPEEKKEEAQKPREEDFKSFQDWLSSLLK
uniref:Tetratricopeptide repeat protein n=1 Tax=candidate division WOR-3 bacterium TaxID=2052148 RepID=A0A7V3RGC7_UNCW3